MDLYAIKIRTREDEPQEKYLWFETLEKAVDIVMNDFFNTDKDEVWIREEFENGDKPCCVELHNGELYWQYRHREYTLRNMLCIEGRNQLTISDLREYMKQGGELGPYNVVYQIITLNEYRPGQTIKAANKR